MFSASNVEPLLGVEGYALSNRAEVTAELSKDVAKLVAAVCLLNHPQVDEAISRITGGRGRERERLKTYNSIVLLIEASSIYIYQIRVTISCIVYTETAVSL